MRDLCAEKNVIEIQDNLAGVSHEFHYRIPTTRERMQYQGGLWERKGKKIISKALNQQIKSGAAILTGFKPGTLAVSGKEISSNPSDPGYREDWKELLVKSCPELVAVLARTVFENASVAGDSGGIEFAVADDDGEVVVEDADPLAK